MLRAWGDAFTSSDDVTLLIKTFPNPHNTAQQLLAEARRGNPHYPNVVVIEEDLADGQLKALVEMSDALVAPSRGEGFGLPIAEAMLSGLPVIATGYGGHMDFCDAENTWLVDYEFARAKMHFGLVDSIWVEPCADDLARQLRALHGAAEPNISAVLSGAGAVVGWVHLGECCRAGRGGGLSLEVRQCPRIGEDTSRLGVELETRCGIAAYSAYLTEHFDTEVQVYASRRTREEELDKLLLPADGESVGVCWSSGFGDDLSELREALFADYPVRSDSI